jgi:hypothetical protein
VPDAQRLLAAVRRRRFERGEIVFHRTTRPTPWTSSARPVRGAGHDAARRHGDDCGSWPGETFGETALLAAHAKRMATVRAIEPAETFALGESEFARLRTERSRSP